MPRGIQRAMDEAMGDTPVVCLLGPRQCGKSTLARVQGPDRPYLTLDDDNLLAGALKDPGGFVARLPDRVTLDEIQRAPRLLLAIKRSVDEARRPGRFLLTGSANLMQLPDLADSLAGRMECVHLHPLTESEKDRSGGHLLRRMLAGDFGERFESVLREDTIDPSSLVGRVVRGGFPEVRNRPYPRARQWHRQYLRAVIDRDVHDVARVRDAAEIGRLLELLAHQTGCLLNASALGNDLRIDRQTVDRYLSVLERLFLIRRLPPWHRSDAKRLIKTPKVHLTDSGLAASLSGLTASDWNAKRDRFGRLLESFVLQQLVAQAGWTDPDLRFWHYRDKDQVEVDVVITRGLEVWGVEVKASMTLRPSDGRGLKRLAALAGRNFRGGVVLYDGHLMMPLESDPPIHAVPLEWFWQQ
ncbi:ATP-binding protein [Haloferula sp. A504]|uniref:ATP-binding protein n=1 Tax=Haloferula sp. A504 TaxID=3373601 RepID=UPI0031C05DF5|nr:ATP-binding protein [Verrucomicrobiaceae bacterium E54]